MFVCRLSILDDMRLTLHYFLGATAYQLISPVLVCPHCLRSSLKSQGWCYSKLCSHYIICNVSWESSVCPDQSPLNHFLCRPCHLYLFSSPTGPYAAAIRNFSPFSEYATVSNCVFSHMLFLFLECPSLLSLHGKLPLTL